MKTSEINTIHREIAALRRGALKPLRAWKVERLPDGTIRRTAMHETKAPATKVPSAKKLAGEAREALKITQKDFATLIGVSVRTLHQWEQGRRKPTGAALALLRIARSSPRAVLKALHGASAA